MKTCIGIAALAVANMQIQTAARPMFKIQGSIFDFLNLVDVRSRVYNALQMHAKTHAFTSAHKHTVTIK
jgi:hypothetical protein